MCRNGESWQRFSPTSSAVTSFAVRRLAVTFAAALELARAGRIELRQESAFGPIHVRSRAHPTLRRRWSRRLKEGGGTSCVCWRPCCSPPRSRSARTIFARHLGPDADVRPLVRELSEALAGRGVNLVRVAGGWTFRTAP